MSIFVRPVFPRRHLELWKRSTYRLLCRNSNAAGSRNARRKPKSKVKIKRQRLPYTEDDLKFALHAVVVEGTTINAASRTYGIPRPTLYHRLKSNQFGKMKMGPDPFLGDDGEERLKEWIINTSQSCPVKKMDVIDAAQRLVEDMGKRNFKNGKPGTKWYKGFLKRHPDIEQIVKRSKKKDLNLD